MGGRLEGKVALVTGASSGLGAAAVRRFLEEGARVVCADIKPPAEAPAGDPERTVQVRCDHTDAHDCRAAVDAATTAWGRLDVLFNNAGTGYAGDFAETEFDAFQNVMATNVDGPWQMTASALDALRAAADDGRFASSVVLYTASGLGVRARRGCAPYAVSKHAVIGMMRALAADLGPSNIRVNALCPGLVDTPASRAMANGWQGRTADETFEAYRRMSPMGRLATDDDVAEAAAFLASDAARAINSAALLIDYGTIGA